MKRIPIRACSALTVMSLLSGTALAQDGYASVTFTVQVTGVHNVPTSEGGFRNVGKSRTFTGKARMKYAGAGFAQPAPKGYDKGSFEREKDACEQKHSDEEKIAECQDEVQERQNAAERAVLSRGNPVAAALAGPRNEVWVDEGCSGEVSIADKGTYRGITPGSGRGLEDVPYSLSAKQSVIENAPGSDGCSFNLVYDPQTQTAQINIDPGPLRMEAVERVGAVSSRIHLNPLDWSSIRKFEKGDIKVVAGKNGHSGEWKETTGEPMAMVGATRVKGEVVQTVTRITWQFAKAG